jgi:COP9 signalosome complex subunit 5
MTGSPTCWPQEPWLAVVVDPMRTMAAGKVEIGAFR